MKYNYTIDYTKPNGIIERRSYITTFGKLLKIVENNILNGIFIRATMISNKEVA